MKKNHREIVLPIDEERRRQIMALMEEAIRNAPVPFPRIEMSRLWVQINRLKQLTYKEKVRQLQSLLNGQKRKAPKCQKPMTVIYRGFRKGRKH